MTMRPPQVIRSRLRRTSAFLAGGHTAELNRVSVTSSLARLTGSRLRNRALTRHIPVRLFFRAAVSLPLLPLLALGCVPGNSGPPSDPCGELADCCTPQEAQCLSIASAGNESDCAVALQNFGCSPGTGTGTGVGTGTGTGTGAGTGTESSSSSANSSYDQCVAGWDEFYFKATSACMSCVSQNCGSDIVAVCGSGWMSGCTGGTDGPAITCVCHCDATESAEACFNQCDPSATGSQYQKENACLLAHCNSECT